jgi:hypothetical protein
VKEEDRRGAQRTSGRLILHRQDGDDFDIDGGGYRGRDREKEGVDRSRRRLKGDDEIVLVRERVLESWKLGCNRKRLVDLGGTG